MSPPLRRGRRRSGASRRGPQPARRTLLLGALGVVVLGGGRLVLGSWQPPRPPWAWLTVPPAAGLTQAQRAFIDDVGHAARAYRGQVGLPPSLVVAIAINESAWGQSMLAQHARNYFGVKAVVGSGTLGAVEEDTAEVVDGHVVHVRAPFRAYRSLDESVLDLGQFLHANDRYASLWTADDDPRAAAHILLDAGYATDPAWADKLTRLIDDFALERLDA